MNLLYNLCQCKVLTSVFFMLEPVREYFSYIFSAEFSSQTQKAKIKRRKSV